MHIRSNVAVRPTLLLIVTLFKLTGLLIPKLARLDSFDVVHIHYPFIFGSELTLLSRLRKSRRSAALIVHYKNRLIGNGAYAHVTALPNPANDARAIAKNLRPNSIVNSGAHTRNAFAHRHSQRSVRTRKKIRVVMAMVIVTAMA